MDCFRVWVLITSITYGETLSAFRKLTWTLPGCTGNTIRIGTPLTLDCCSRFSNHGRAQLQSYELFFQWLHEEEGGIWIGGHQHCVELILGDDRSNTTLVSEITEQLLYTEGIHFFLSPYSSLLTGPMAALVNNSDAVMVSSHAEQEYIFFDRPRVFGTFPTPSRVLAGVFEILANTSQYQWHRSILDSTRRGQAVLQPASVVAVSPWWSPICDSVESIYAKQYNLTYLGGVQMNPSDFNNLTLFNQKVEDIIELQPELVIGCDLDKTVVLGSLACIRLVQEFHKHGFEPKAFVFTNCLGLSEFQVELGRQADLVIGVTDWQAGLEFESEWAQMNSAEFESLYKGAFDVGNVPYQAASAWAAAEVLVQGIQRASSTDPKEVANAISKMNIQSVCGPVAFDENGQSLRTLSTVQIQDMSPTPVIVGLPSDLRSRLIYPGPSNTDLACFRNDREEYELYGIDPISQLCKECASGHVSHFFANVTNISGRRCEACKPGKFRRQDDQFCRDCPKGQTAASFGASVCDDCPPAKYIRELGQTQCKPCEPGKVQTYPGAGRCFDCRQGEVAASTSDFCIACGPGTFADTESSNCTGCAPGRFSNGVLIVRCEDCEAGHFASEQETTKCDTCEVGRYQDSKGGTACIGCAVNLSSQVNWVTMYKVMNEWAYLNGSTDNSSCGCRRGFRLEGGECIQCGEGMTCPGMGEMRILEGFYSPSSVSVYHCFGDKRSCPGGIPGHTCAAGKTGISCAACERSKRDSSDGTCIKCEGMDWFPLLLICSLAVLVVIVIYLSHSTATRVARSHVVMLAMIACNQITIFIQQLGVIGMFDLEFPRNMKGFLSLMDIFNFDIRLIRTSCFADPSGLGHFLASVFAFFLVFVMMSFLHFLMVCFLHRDGIRKQTPLYIAAIGTICLLIFIPVVSTVLRPLSCSEHPNGKSTVRTFRDVACWDNDSNDHKIMIIVGICFLFLPLGFFAFVVKILLQVPHKVSMGDVEFLHTYSFLIARFRPGMYWYLNIMLGRSLLISIIPVLPNVVVQIVCFDICNKAFVAGLIQFKPWRVAYSNRLDIFCSSVILLMVNMSAFCVKDDGRLEVFSWICVVGASATVLLSSLCVLRCLFIVLRRNQKPYKYFLCHHKARAGAFARLLKMALSEHHLRQYKPAQVFLDSDDLSQLDNLFHTVGHDLETLVIIGTPDVFLRPWCAGEMTVARLKNVKVTLLAMPGWQPPDDEQIKHFSELVDMNALTENNISLEMVQTTMQWIASLPVIHFPLELDSTTMRSLVDLLTSGAQKGNVLLNSMHSSPSRSSTSCSTSRGAEQIPGLLILVDDTDMDRVAAAGILERLLRPALIGHAEDIPTVHRASEPLPLKFESIIVMCTKGCFDQPEFLEVLVQACRVRARVLPVIADPNFSFPTQDGLAEMRSRPSMVGGARMAQVTDMITCIFKEIAAVFQPQHASDTILQVNAKHIAQRILSRACNPINGDLVSRDWMGNEVLRLSHRSCRTSEVDSLMCALNEKGVNVSLSDSLDLPLPPTILVSL